MRVSRIQAAENRETVINVASRLFREHGFDGIGLKDLMEETLSSATKEGADSDYYEAHAVLLNLKRKQMDSAGGTLTIARDQKDAELRKAATAFKKTQKTTSDALTDELAAQIAAAPA